MSPTWRLSVVLSLALLGTVPLQAQSLQLHFMDVGQGDGAVLIAPNGASASTTSTTTSPAITTAITSVAPGKSWDGFR